MNITPTGHANVSPQRKLFMELLNTIQERIKYYTDTNTDINTDINRGTLIDFATNGLDEEASDDWEECLEGEDGCEMFYMDEEEDIHKYSVFSNQDSNGIVLSNTHNNDDIDNDSETDSTDIEMNDLELIEIRQQYLMQSSRYRSIDNIDIIDNDKDTIIKNLKEQIIELNNKLIKCEKNYKIE